MVKELKRKAVDMAKEAKKPPYEPTPTGSPIAGWRMCALNKIEIDEIDLD
jgi:hypothetical protein